MRKYLNCLLVLLLLAGCSTNTITDKKEVVFANSPQTTKVETKTIKKATTSKEINNEVVKETDSEVITINNGTVKNENTNLISVSYGDEKKQNGNAPVVSGNKLTLEVGSKTSLTSGIVAQDSEDGIISVSDEDIIESNVNVNKAGNYYLIITIKDHDGNETLFRREVDVINPIGVYLNGDGNLEIEYNGNDAGYDVYMYISGYVSDDGAGVGYKKLNSSTIAARNSYVVELASVSTKRNSNCTSAPFYVNSACTYNNKTYNYEKKTSVMEFIVKDSNDASYESYDLSTYNDNLPLALETSEEYHAFQLKLYEEGLPDNKVYADVKIRQEVNGSYKGVKAIVNGVETDSKGLAEIDYNRGNGLSIIGIFDTPGTYEIKVKVYDKNGTYYNEETTFSVIEPFKIHEFVGDIEVTCSIVAGTSYQDGYRVKIGLSQDLDLTNEKNSVSVTFDYGDDTNCSYGSITADISKFTEVGSFISKSMYEVIEVDEYNDALERMTSYFEKNGQGYFQVRVKVTDSYGVTVKTESIVQKVEF